MSTAADLTDLTRAMASELVEREERRSGSRMIAYRDVGSAVGASASWIRKFVAGSAEAKEPRWSVGLQIIAAYDRLCSRIEQEAELERRRILALRGKIDAAFPSGRQLDQKSMRASPAGADDPAA